MILSVPSPMPNLPDGGAIFSVKPLAICLPLPLRRRQLLAEGDDLSETFSNDVSVGKPA
jgi:hypothetical protein